jgi:murein DD-endopeptidase MepM/ murein hydrolase activator NlpD
MEDIDLSELSGMVVNPFHPPRSGSDDPHQGVDFAYRLNGDSNALEGLPVGAVLEGEVVAVLNDRFPYGNAIMIETSLEGLANESIAKLQIPTPAPTRSPHPALTCPKEYLSSTWHTEKRSLYLLYAHLLEPVPYEPGEEISCGQMLGATGSTGNALNPHIHLEVRVGPTGAGFPSMAHYDTSATEEEMALYCTWRVSELFQLLDPMRLFDPNPLYED